MLPPQNTGGGTTPGPWDVCLLPPAGLLTNPGCTGEPASPAGGRAICHSDTFEHKEVACPGPEASVDEMPRTGLAEAERTVLGGARLIWGAQLGSCEEQRGKQKPVAAREAVDEGRLAFHLPRQG